MFTLVMYYLDCKLKRDAERYYFITAVLDFSVVLIIVGIIDGIFK